MGDSILRCLQPTLPSINRLPTDVFVLIPHFFTYGKEWTYFPMNRPLITMTHVCQSWRNVLLSTPSLWTQIDFSESTESQQEAFLRRSGKQLLDVYHFLDGWGPFIQPHFSITYHNLFRLRGLWITSMVPYLDQILMDFSSAAAPELKYLEIVNETTATEFIKLPKLFGGQMPKLRSLVLHGIRDTNFCGFNFPSLAQFSFKTESEITVQDLTSLFERCPLLELVEIDLCYEPQQPTPPPPKRVCLAALQKLMLSGAACTSGLLDHLILPGCTFIMLHCGSTRSLGSDGLSAARIHPSSIDHLPVTRGITKAVAMAYMCVFSGPNGTLRFWSSKNFDAEFVASFSPISLSHITELLIIPKENRSKYAALNNPWEHTISGACGAFEAFTAVEDLTIASCVTEPLFTALGMTVNSGILLPGLRRLSIDVGYGDLNVSTLFQCAKARKEHSRLLEEVTIVWGEDPGADVIQAVESLREYVGELTQRVSAPAPDFD